MSVIDVAVTFFLHAYIVPLLMFYMYMYHVTGRNKAVYCIVINRYSVLRESWRSLENMQKQRSRMASVSAHQHLCCSLPR